MAEVTKNYRQESRKQYVCKGDDSYGVTLEQLNAGSLQRIADAVELMAKKYSSMEEELEMYQRMLADKGNQVDTLRRSCRALRGQITKLKNKSKNHGH